MDTNTSRFVFKGYEMLPEQKQVRFFYTVHHHSEVFHFTDTLMFPKHFHSIPSEVLTPFLQSLSLILGISYWKLFCPQAITIESFSLTKQQAIFWEKVYTKGLGEFFYANNIDFHGLIHFPYDSSMQPMSLMPFSRKEQSLVPIGGGKDGIVVGELMKKLEKPFDILLIYTNIQQTQAQEEVSQQLGKPVLRIYHMLDPQLLELNKRKDAYNGHVPMVAMHSFIELLTALLYDYSFIVLGNEESANYGNVEYLGETMNHQWSKSLEFEALFQEYIEKYVTKNIKYFSLIRAFSEIKIAQIFSQHPEYFSHFVSCNRGFTMAQKGKTHWCGHCPKCAFVFVMLAAFLPKQTVLDIFGKNLFEDKSLLSLYKELLGLKDFKPFECVGTPEEVALAFSLASQKTEWDTAKIMQFFTKEVLPQLNTDELERKLLFSQAQQRIPREFQKVLSI